MKRLKLFFACLLMAVLSIGQMWAAVTALSLPKSWGASDGSSAYTEALGCTKTSLGSDYSSAPKLKFNAAGSSLVIQVADAPDQISFTFKQNGANAGTFKVQESADGTNYTDALTVTWPGNSKTSTPVATLQSTSRYIKLVYVTKGSSTNAGVGGISITKASGGGSDPIAVSEVTLDEDEIALEAGEKQTLTATVSPDNATNKNVTWESDDTDVATVENGLVTAVAEGTATITCKSEADATKFATCDVTVTAAEVPTLTFDFSAKGYENGVQYSSIDADANITITFGNGDNDGKYYNTGTAMRVYSSGHMTIAGEEGVTISKIVLEFGSGDGSNEISTTVGTYAAGKWTGSEQSVTFNVGGSSGHRRIKVVKVFYEAEAIAVAKPTISGVTPFLSSTEVTLTQNDADAIYYTMGADPDDPTTNSTLYEGPFDLSATATVKAIAVKGGVSSAVASATFTKITPLTVANALSAASGTNVYVTGTITSITEVSIQHKNATYVISDVTAGVPANEMIIYRGKYVDGADFDSEDQIHVGDVVVVSGTIGVYQEKNQLAQGNQIESITPAAVVAPVFSPNGGGFMGETDVTITCATEGSAIYYTLNGTTPTKSSTQYTAAIHLDATTTITAIAYVGEESSLVVAKEFTLTAPMTVAEALAALDSENPINNVAVAGIISTAPTANPSSGKLTYFISDDGSASNELEVYKGFGVAGASFSDKADLQVGDEVTVFGNLTIYNTTKEFAEGSRLIAFNRPQVDVESISLTESTAEVEEGKTVTLHASVVPANATNKTIVWSVQSGDTYASVDENGVVTGIAAGEAVIRAASDEDATIFAECTVTVTAPTPLSPWASVYTSNVEIASNTAAHVTINGEDYDAAKTSKGASATITLPQGVTTIHLHLVAWSGEAQTVSVTGDCFNEAKELSIEANAGVSGSGTTYDLGESGTDYYFSLTPDNEVAANTVITIAAASGKRFVLFGVNQEGAVTLESISVSGTATALEYNEGDHFSPAGLGVTGHYSDASTAPITEGIVWAFDPDPLTEGTTSVSVTATAGGFTSAAFVVDGLTVAGAAPLSPWASVYTSNVEIASNTAAHVTINEENFDAAKTSKGASATITLPQGVTTIHLHLVAWSGEAQTVSVTGDCFNEAKELSIEANAGVSGSGTTYDLGESGTDYYFSLTPDNEVAANTVITIAAEGQKRFVLFGVNQEGGVVPVLKSIAISGDLDKKSYKAGQSLDMTGLEVSATYQLGEETPYNVDITNDAELELTYDPLVENQTSVTITATYKGQTDDITINDLVVTSADPKIYVDPSLTVNFGSVEVGEAVPANKTITVTLTNVAAATATLGGTNPEAFSIDKTALVDGDVITISVIASTAAAASYSATITITDDAAAATEKVVNLSFAVTEPVVEETAVSTTSKWVAATDADLVDGAEVLITGATGGVTYAIGVQNDNNRAAVAGTLEDDVFTPGENTMSFTLVAQETEGVFALQASNGEYLYAASSSKNYLKRQATIDDNAKWTLTATSAVANGSNTRNDLKFNATNSPKIFSCYASGQTAIQFYVPKQDTPEPPVVDYTEVRNGLNEGEYYTMCLEKAVTAVKAGSIWKVLSKAANGTDVILEEVTGTLDAGRPYIFRAAASTLEVAYTGDAVLAPLTEGNNGLVGSFSQVKIANVNTNYIIYNNALYFVNTDNVYVGEHRAYLDMTGVPNYEPQQGSGAPRRRVVMTVHGEQTATGMENVQGDNVQCTKVLINGQMYILRGEKMFDATGRLVK